MEAEQWRRFYRLRERVFAAIDKIVNDPEDDGHHKSYEGAMDVAFHFGDYFTSNNVFEVEFVNIELHCYLLVNGRHKEWTGRTFAEALDKAEAGIEEILRYAGR